MYNFQAILKIANDINMDIKSIKPQNKLPLYGIWPLYVYIIISLTVVGITLSHINIIPVLNINFFKIPLIIVAIILIVFWIYLRIRAVIIEKIDQSINKNQLRTTGIYFIVRNPIYSAFLLVCTWAILIHQNIYLIILPIIYRVFLTILLKHTEEKRLLDLFGSEYITYCKQVNRCFPKVKTLMLNLIKNHG